MTRRTVDLLALSLLAVFAGALIAAGNARVSPTDSVNPVIGDVSFFEAFGRQPTPEDDNALRVSTHLAHVERRLRAVDDSRLPDELRAERRKNLDLLRAYGLAGVFPAGESREGRLPTFVDGAGRRCAVAALFEAAAGTEAVMRVNARFRNAYVREMDDAAIAGWIASSGLTIEEAAMIQPTYEEDRRFTWGKWQLVTDARPFYLQQVAGQRLEDAQRAVGLAIGARVYDCANHWNIGANADVGHTLTGGLLYRGEIRAGYTLHHGPGTSVLATLAPQLDGVQNVITPALAVPLGLRLALDPTFLLTREEGRSVLMLRAGAGPVVWGRPLGVAWTAGVDVAFHVFRQSNVGFTPRALIASLTFTRLGETVYGGVALGIAFWQRLEGGVYPLFGPY